MVDWQEFDCQTCARAPHLQNVQGCFVPAPRVFLKLLDHEFTRCPVRYQSKTSHILVTQMREGVLDGLGYAHKMAMPAKRLSALRYLEALLKVTRDDRT